MSDKLEVEEEIEKEIKRHGSEKEHGHISCYAERRNLVALKHGLFCPMCVDNQSLVRELANVFFFFFFLHITNTLPQGS